MNAIKQINEEYLLQTSFNLIATKTRIIIYYSVELFGITCTYK